MFLACSTYDELSHFYICDILPLYQSFAIQINMFYSMPFCCDCALSVTSTEIHYNKHTKIIQKNISDRNLLYDEAGTSL